jgi:adenylate kinase
MDTSPLSNDADASAADGASAGAKELFADVWRELEASAGDAGPVFPKEVSWLNGAPGAGKGTHTPSILHHLACAAAPIVTSDLLKSPRARALIDSGLLVGDREVAGLLLAKLAEPQLRDGVVVDGFPRTAAQAEFTKLLHAKLAQRHAADPARFPAPKFRVIVLYVDEDESVARQMKRGAETLAAGNAEVRKTDLDASLARKRYQVFARETLTPLQALCGTFPYHQISTDGSIEEVGRRIVEALQTE